MNWTKFAVVMVAGLGLSALLRSGGFYNALSADAEGLGMLVQLIGAIYAVLLAFLIFVIWGQFTEVEDCVMRECNALDDVLRFSRYLDAESHSNIRRALTAYTSHVVRFEWDALGDGRTDQQSEQIFGKFVASVVEAQPRTEQEKLMLPRLIDMVQQASRMRDERVARSITRMPPTLFALVTTIACALLLVVFLYPFHYWYTGAGGFVVTAFLLYMANVVMTDTDNPL